MKSECLFKVAEIQVSYNPSADLGPVVNNTNDTLECLSEFFDKSTIALQEQFVVIYLNSALRIIGVYKHTRGTMSATLVDVKLIMATGIQLAAHNIIVAHNHPSGRLTPSNADLQITAKLKKAGSLLDIEVLDHIIVDCQFKHFSFCKNDLL